MTAAVTAPVHQPASRSFGLTRQLVRLHRPALYIWAFLVLAVSALLLWLGGPLTDAAATAWRQYHACHTARCSYDQAAILRYKDMENYSTFAVLAVPLLAAAWAGASLTGREMENGTATLAWTQGISPARWLAAKLAVPSVVLATGTGLLVTLHHRSWSAGQGRIDTAKPWHDTGIFYANGPALVALTLAGLVIGALAGLVLRGSLAALVTGVVTVSLAWFGLRVVQPFLWPTVTRVSSLRHGLSGSGITIDEGFVTADGAHHPLLSDCGPNYYAVCRPAYNHVHATAFYHEYHPIAHYWPLQLTAAALVLAVAGALTVTAFRILRSRTGGAAALGGNPA